jgi:hypothetical protein
MAHTLYEIRVAGVVPESDLQDMGAVTAAPDQVNTILYGVRDQAALYCLLARLRALGIETIGLRRGPAAAPAPTADGDDFPLHTCYEVALTGTCGPVFTAVFKSLGVKRAVTTSNFLLPVPHPARIRDIVAMLEARGLMILHIDGREQ